MSFRRSLVNPFLDTLEICGKRCSRWPVEVIPERSQVIVIIGMAFQRCACNQFLPVSSTYPFLDVRTAVLNGTLENAFRQHYPGFRPANDEGTTAAAA